MRVGSLKQQTVELTADQKAQAHYKEAARKQAEWLGKGASLHFEFDTHVSVF
mgnify:FL=1